MEIASYKKYVTPGFIALFVVWIINLISANIPLEYEGFLWYARILWWVFSYMLQIGIIAYLCFFPRCQALVAAKIGGCLYILLELIYTFNEISFVFTKENLIYSPGIFEYLTTLLLYAPGILLFFWGSKLWLPVKILMTVSTGIDVACEMIWAQLLPMYQSPIYSIEQTEPLRIAVQTLGIVPLFFILISLILTGIWMNMRSKTPVYENQTVEAV